MSMAGGGAYEKVDFNKSVGFHQLFTSYFILQSSQISDLASDI
jgi:hypothetical protein